MQNFLSPKNKKKIWVALSLVGIASLVIMFSTKLFFPFVLYPVEVFISGLIYIGQDVKTYFIRKDELEKENRRLKREIQNLKLQLNNLEYIKSENEILRKYLNFKTEYGVEKFLIGKVIGVSPDSWINSFRIDVGLEDGVKKGDLVVYDGYLVGIVDRVYPNFSYVLAVNDRNFRITVKTKKTGESCLYQGFEGGTGYLKYVRPEQDIRVGDTVITENISQNIPAGIPIGVIKGISQKEGEFFRTVEVSLLYRQNVLSYVMVVSR